MSQSTAGKIPSDLEIAHAATLRPIGEIAATLGLHDDELDYYGRYKAKVSLSALDRLRDRPNGKYVLVTAVTPTPLGEGKTTTTIGLVQGLAHIGHKAAACLRQPSLGPVFGIKGGAAGGGYSQVVPMEDINLHLTGDMHAVSSAHALLSALVDTLLIKGNPARLDPTKITWRRCVDMNDGALRSIVVGLQGNGIPRETGFDLTAASEVMAVLSLATSLKDLRERLGRIIVGYNHLDLPVSTEDLRAAGAMAILLREAIKPNLMQTLEHAPAFVHCGPFANIAHGNSSILADRIALKCADYVVTEAGFGADMGMEKFYNIKCRVSGLAPDAVCMVATVRALKAHSGRYRVIAGRTIDPRLFEPGVDALREGLPNLIKHLENARHFGVPCVVAINKFPSDTDDEIQALREGAEMAGAVDVVVCEGHARGGAGAAALAEAIVKACRMPREPFRFLYPLDWPIQRKIETIATTIYGARGVHFEKPASAAIDRFTKLGWDKLPICMAKTQYSLSHDPTLRGRPSDFVLPVRDIRISAGAGFLYALCGEIMTMPAFGSRPAALNMDIDEAGNVHGLF
jgi:formate--tetrahydrofolate ligase